MVGKVGMVGKLRCDFVVLYGRMAKQMCMMDGRWKGLRLYHDDDDG